MPRKRQKNWEGEWTSSFADDSKVNSELRKLTNSAGWVAATNKSDSRVSPGSSRASTPPSVISSSSRKSDCKNSQKFSAKPEKKKRGRPPGKGKSKKFKMVLEKDSDYEVDYVSPDDEATADDSDTESKDMTSDVLSNDDYSLGEEDDISSVGEPVSWVDDQFSDIELDEDAPKLNYPPSSLDLLVPNELVLAALEVYEILRHFRSCLRLSPMLFEDFCAALIDEETNVLLTECFVSTIKSLLKEEEAASVAFGPQDQKDAVHASFNFLDHLTWPEVVKSYLESSPEFAEALAIVENVKFPCVGAADKLIVLKTLTDVYLTSNKIRDQLMKDGVIQYDDHCRVCHKLGDLLCCETCSAVYHLACCDPPLEEVPEDEWHCEVCTAHKLNGVYNCEPQHEFRGQYLRHDPIGTDRHGNKYWFLARRLIIEGENETWYYSTQDQFNQVISMLDPEKYEMVLCEALKDTAEEFPKYSAITRNLTEEALPEDKNKSYLEVAIARLKREERERKLEVEKKKREEEEREKKEVLEREETTNKEETKEKIENSECENEKQEQKVCDMARPPTIAEVPVQDASDAKETVSASGATSTIGASGDSNAATTTQTVENETDTNMTINAAGDGNATPAVPLTNAIANEPAITANHIDFLVSGTDDSKTTSATPSVPDQTESKPNDVSSKVNSGAPPSAKTLAPIPVTMQNSPSKNIQLIKLGQGIQIKKPSISGAATPGLSSGTVSQLKSLFVLNKDGTKTQIMLGPAGKIVAPGNNVNQSLNRQILVLNSGKVSIPKINPDMKKIQIPPTTKVTQQQSPGNSQITGTSDQNVKMSQVPKVEIKQEDENLTPEEESRKYFRLGEDKAYKQYVNHFTENTLALNKYHHKEERDRERHLGYKFSMSGQGEFKWIGDMLGNETTVIQTIRSTLLHLEHQIPLCFMHTRWDKYRKAWGKIVMKCSTPQSFAAALGILEMATRVIVKRSIWKDSLGLTKLQRVTSGEKEEFEKKRKYKNRIEEDESNKNAVWCKYPIPVRSTLVWKMKGEEYRMTGYAGWFWISSTRRYIHSPAKPKPHVLVHEVKNENQQTVTHDHSSVSTKQEIPPSSNDIETDSEKSQSTTSTSSTKSIDFTEDKLIHDSLVEEASSKDIVMSQAESVASQFKTETSCDQTGAIVCDVINVSENLLKRTPLYNRKWAASKVDILLGWRLMQREAEKKRETVESSKASNSEVSQAKPLPPTPRPTGMPDLQKIKDVTTTTNVINPSNVIMSPDVNNSTALKTAGGVTQVSLKTEVKCEGSKTELKNDIINEGLQGHGSKVEGKNEVEGENSNIKMKEDVRGEEDLKVELKNEVEVNNKQPTNEKELSSHDKVLQSNEIHSFNKTEESGSKGVTPVATTTNVTATMTAAQENTNVQCSGNKDSRQSGMDLACTKSAIETDTSTSATESSTASVTDQNSLAPDESKPGDLTHTENTTATAPTASKDTTEAASKTEAVPDEVMEIKTGTKEEVVASKDTTLATSKTEAVSNEAMEVTTESKEEMVDVVTDTVTGTKTTVSQDATMIETTVTTVTTTVEISKTIVSAKNSLPQQNASHLPPQQNVAQPPVQDPISITTTERSRTRMTRMSRIKREINRTLDVTKVTEQVWKLKRYRKTSTTLKREQAMKLPLPWKFNAGKGKKKSIFRLPSSPLRKLAVSGGMWSYGSGFNYNTKFVSGLDMFWIYTCPRPVFSMVWRYKLQKVCTFASICHLLRMFWHSIKWDEITTKPQTDDVVHTVTTDEEIVTTELLKRKDNLKTGMKSEYYIRRITMPILDPEEEALRSIKPGENYTPSRKGLRSSTRPMALRDRPKKESGPNVEMIWVPEDQVQLWQIRQFGSLLKQQQNNQKFQQRPTPRVINQTGNTFLSSPTGALLPTFQNMKGLKTSPGPGFNIVKLPLSNQNQRLISSIQQQGTAQPQHTFLTKPKTYSMMVGKPGQVQKIIMQPSSNQTHSPFKARVNQSPQTLVRGPSGINYIVQGNKMLKPIIIKAGSQVVTTPVQTKPVHPTIRLNDGSSPIMKFQQSPAGSGINIRHQILQHRIQSSSASSMISKIAPKTPNQTQIKLTSSQLSQLMKVNTGTSVRVSVSLGNGKTGIGQLQIIPPGAQVTPSAGQQLMQTRVGGEVRRFLFTLLTENNSNASQQAGSNEVSLNSASLHQRLQQIQKHQHAASGIRGNINSGRQSTDMKRLLTDKDPLWGSRPLTPERSQIIRKEDRVDRLRKKPMSREEREDSQRHSVVMQVVKSILDRIERKEELDMRKKKREEVLMKQKEKKEQTEQAKAQNRQNHFLNKHRDQLKQDILKRRAIVEKYLTHSVKNELREDQKKQRRQYSTAPASGEGPVSKKPKKAYGNAIVTSAVLTENNSKQRRMSHERKQMNQPIAGKKRKFSSPPPDNKKQKMINTHHRKKDNKLYCICKTPYDSTKFYIGCDLCLNWFHGSCVGIPESQAKQMDEWICEECKKAREEPAQELYCLCKTPYDDSKFYIGCDICQEWYHGSCVGVTEIESSTIEFYTCPRCKRENRDSRDHVLAENNLSHDDYITLSKVIKSLRSHKMAWPFLHPVSALEVPSYYKIVKRPMDLGTVTKKMKTYKKLSELVSDVSLIFDNCRQFNGADSALAKCAEILESLFVGKMREFRSRRGSR